MIIISYDISDDKLRTQFSKLLDKHGRRLQYSVFEIKNSARLIKLIKSHIEHYFAKRFAMTDSVFILPVCEWCEKKVYRLWYAVHEEEEVVFM